jgi:hypothetical protein
MKTQLFIFEFVILFNTSYSQEKYAITNRHCREIMLSNELENFKI